MQDINEVIFVTLSAIAVVENPVTTFKCHREKTTDARKTMC